MVGGTGLIKCSKEDFEKLEKKVSARRLVRARRSNRNE